MAYCRFNPKTSDVYVISTRKGLECISCRLTDFEPHGDPRSWYQNVTTKDEQGMLSHLLTHIGRKHKVPKSAVNRLKKEIRNGTN